MANLTNNPLRAGRRRRNAIAKGLALAATAFGLVLHNANLAGIAAALLMLSLARPAPAAE